MNPRNTLLQLKKIVRQNTNVLCVSIKAHTVVTYRTTSGHTVGRSHTSVLCVSIGVRRAVTNFSF